MAHRALIVAIVCTVSVRLTFFWLDDQQQLEARRLQHGGGCEALFIYIIA
jgi:hypothetical protein